MYFISQNLEITGNYKYSLDYVRKQVSYFLYPISFGALHFDRPLQDDWTQVIQKKNLLLKPGLQVAMLKLGSSSSNIVGRVELRIAVLVQFGGGRTLYTACVTNY